MGIFSRLKGGKKKEKELLILYGTKSGNSKLIAERTQKYYQKIGVDSLCKNMAGYKPVKLAEINNLLVIVSTHGEGEPPPSATAFFNECMSDSMPNLKQLNYSICALGDSSYSEFCWAGKELDKRLCDLGAKPFFPRMECDLEFSNDAIQWIKKTAEDFAYISSSKESDDLSESAFSIEKQYSARIKARTLLTKGENIDPVSHLELDIGDSNLIYSVGDSVGIIPQNPKWLVELIINQFNTDAIEEYSLEQLRNKFLTEYEITSVSKRTIEDIYKATNAERLAYLLNSNDKLNEFVSVANLFDLLTDFKIEMKIEDLLGLLPKLKERIYSIASSHSLKPNELHLTIKTIRYKFKDRKHEGAASVYANKLLENNDFLKFNLYRNENFKLPESTVAPIIMIGVSTGIAPFRAILQDRQAKQVAGNTWLIWGNKKSQEDFLYNEDLQNFLDNNVLENLDVVFSQDGKGKSYVSNVLIDKKDTLITWINKGALIYVCGSTKMGQSVKNTLDDVLVSHSSSTNTLRSEGRYYEDLY